MRNYWWLGVMKDVGKYVEECDMCQRMKNRTKMPVGKLKLSEVPEKLWTHLTVDFITKLLVVCYDSRLKVLSQETTLVLSNTRELDRVPKTK